MREVKVIQESAFHGQKAGLSFNTPFEVTSGTNIATICGETHAKIALDIWKLQMHEQLQEVAALKEYVSPVVVTKATALACQLDAFVASITMTLENNAGDLVEIKEKGDALKTQAKQCIVLLIRSIKGGETLRDGMTGPAPAKKQRKSSAKSKD